MKVYKAASYKIFRKTIIKYKMCCINIIFTVNTDFIIKLVYIFVTHYQNKTLYNNLCIFFGTNFMIFVMFVHSILNNAVNNLTFSRLSDIVLYTL